MGGFKMKVSYGDVASPHLQVALIELDSQNLPLKAEHALIGFRKQILEHYGNYETLRMKLVEKHGSRDEAGVLLMNEKKTNYTMSNQEEFDKEFAELCGLEVELNGLPYAPFENVILAPGPRKTLMKFVNP